MDDEEPFGFLPDDDEFVDDPLATGTILPVAPPISADRIPTRYRQSAGASILAAGLLGLRDIIDPPKDDRPVVEQHADEDESDRAIEVYLDPDDPSASIVVVRRPEDDN